MRKINANNIFSPKQALRKTNQEIFTGRSDVLVKAIEEIAVPGASLVIYGERGIGKTSCGWQLLEILSGNHTLLKKLNINNSDAESKKYHCLWVSCSQQMKDIDGLLKELLRTFDYSKKDEFANRNFYSLFPELFEVNTTVKSGQKLEFNLGFVKTSFNSEETESETEDLRTISHQLFNSFNELLHKVEVKYPDDELIIFVDEFDRLPNKKGIGELIKLISNARFVIIGIADSLDDIIQDHESVERKLQGSTFKIEGFSHKDVKDFFKNAERIYPGQVFFEKSFVDAANEYCDGFPYLLHFSGFQALRNKMREKAVPPFSVTSEDFFVGFSQIVDEKGDSVRFKQITSAINDSESKEHILATLANQKSKWVSINHISEIIDQKYLRNIMNNIKFINDKGILVKKEKEYRFKDPIIKAMIKFRAKRNQTFIN